MGSWLPWRKLASNPPGLDWPALPWQSRGLYALLLGLANDLGRIPLGRLGLPSLAGGLNAQWSEIEPCFSALLAAGWAEVDGSDINLPHFADSQRAATSAERMADLRQRARYQSSPISDAQVTIRNASVTGSDEPIAKRHPDKKEIRSEEIRIEGIPKPAAAPPVSEAPAALVLTGSEVKPARTRKARKPADPTQGAQIFAAYSSAFRLRYGVDPPRDSRTNRHFANLAKNAMEGRAPEVSEYEALSEACGVAARYVGHPNAYYAQQSHPPGLLDRDWHKLVTEYRTGRTVTATTARDHERTASNPILEFAAEVRAQEETAKRRKAEVINVDE